MTARLSLMEQMVIMVMVVMVVMVMPLDTKY